MRPVTIVMYHYVRDVAATPYPGIKALSVKDFEGQLDYLQRHFTFIGIAELVSALKGTGDLPPNGVLLTFDDGYSDHYRTVFPMLRERGIRGVFFPAAMPVVERKPLDANKVQFILSQADDVGKLVAVINDAIVESRAVLGLEAPEIYWQRHARASRFDGAEVTFVKRMLQHALPPDYRGALVSRLFAEHVTTDERAFADALYMDADQLRALIAAGMDVGVHGYHHHWMDQLSAAERQTEISRSLDFLRELGGPGGDWVMCYPYGAFDDDLVRLVDSMGASVGVTTVPEVADLDAHHRLCLPRLDTNDLPKVASPTTESSKRAQG